MLSDWVRGWLGRRRHAPSPDVAYRSICQNVYHCTVQKSASQWLRAILSDPRTFRCCGLARYPLEERLSDGVDPRPLTQRVYAEPFPPATILTPLYLTYEAFLALPKPASYRAFFVMRDPRDIVVSWYYSLKYSHALQGDTGRIRQELVRLSEADGLLYTIDYLHEFGLFAAQRSWVGAPDKNANITLTRYETLIGTEQAPELERLLIHCDIRVPRPLLTELLHEYSFKLLSGRPAGQEDQHAHYRKGVAGDWRNHFDDRLRARLHEVAGDVLALWHYS